MQAIDILVGVDRHDHGFLVEALWQRQLNQYPVNGLVGVQLLDQRDQFCLGDIGGQPVFETLHAGGYRRLVLGRNIDLTGRIVADQHHGQTRRATGLVDKGRNCFANPFAQTGGKGLAVNDLRCGQPRSAWASGGRIAS